MRAASSSEEPPGIPTQPPDHAKARDHCAGSVGAPERQDLTAEIEVPAEEILAGPCGYRVHVINYDSTSNILYQPASYEMLESGSYRDPFGGGKPAKTAAKHNDALVNDPQFHSQNVYAIAMRILARFEFALGRRVPWGCDGRPLHIAPHAFADANAFYSKQPRTVFWIFFRRERQTRVRMPFP